MPVSTTLFGDTRTDPYAWLRDRNDPDTIKYLEAENAYTKAMMKSTEELQSKLYAEMLGRIKQTDLSVPVKREEYFYYSRTEEGKQYGIYCRKKGSLESAEEILLDGNVLGEGQKYFRIGNFAVSPNHRLLAYSVDFEGDEMYTIRVMDLETRALLADEIPNTYYTLEWANDNRTFFYTMLDAAKRPYQVYRHTLGAADNSLIYQENDQRYTLALEKTSSRKFLLINIGSSLTSEVRYVSADRPYEPFQIVLPRVQGVEYDLTHHWTRHDRSTSAPTTMPGRFAWCAHRSAIHRGRTGRISCRSAIAPRWKASMRSATTWSSRSATAASARSGFIISPPARLIPSNFRSRFTRPASDRTPNSIRTLCGSITRRW